MSVFIICCPILMQMLVIKTLIKTGFQTPCLVLDAVSKDNTSFFHRCDPPLRIEASHIVYYKTNFPGLSNVLFPLKKAAF